jgi:hypothetical protein
MDFFRRAEVSDEVDEVEAEEDDVRVEAAGLVTNGTSSSSESSPKGLMDFGRGVREGNGVLDVRGVVSPEISVDDSGMEVSSGRSGVVVALGS